MAQSSSSQRQITSFSCGRDELNLIDFPISSLQHQQRKDADGDFPDEIVCTVESYDPDLDEVVPRTLTKRTSSRHGFPTPVDDEVLVGLLTLTRVKNNFTNARIHFRNGELYELMGWPHNGSSNTRLSMALDRLKGLSLKYENSWTIDDGTFQKEFSTGLLDSYKFVKQTAGSRKSDREQSWIQWASEVFSDIQRGNVKELNTDEFFSLRRPISQRLYRFLDKHLSHSPHFEIDLLTFACHLGIAESSHIGKIKERLANGIAELESLNTFIVPASPEERYQKRGPGQWLVRFDRQPARAESSQTLPKANATSRPDDAADRLVREFYRAWRGIDPSSVTKKELEQAGTLVNHYGETSVFDQLPKVVRRMKQSFPDANKFGASCTYFDEVIAKAEKSTQRQQMEQERSQQIEQSKPQSAIHRHRKEQLKKRWYSLPDSKRQEIVQQVETTAPSDSVRRLIACGKTDDPLVMIPCLDELERQIGIESNS